MAKRSICCPRTVVQTLRLNSGDGRAEVIAGGCWWEVRGGFHSEKKKKRAPAFIQQQLQQEAAALNSDERCANVGTAPQRRGPPQATSARHNHRLVTVFHLQRE